MQKLRDFGHTSKNSVMNLAIELVLHLDDVPPRSAHDHDVCNPYILERRIRDMVGEYFGRRSVERSAWLIHTA